MLKYWICNIVACKNSEKNKNKIILIIFNGIVIET